MSSDLILKDRRVFAMVVLLLGTALTFLSLNPAVAALVMQVAVGIPAFVGVLLLMYSVARELYVNGEVNWKSPDFHFSLPFYMEEPDDGGKDAGTPTGGSSTSAGE